MDSVIPRGLVNAHGRAILQYCRQNMGVYSPQTASGIRNASNKLVTTQLLSLHGIQVPKTVYAKESKDVKLLIDLAGGLPVIVKGLTGSQGANVIILDTERSAVSVLESYYKNKQQVLIQEYIPPTKEGASDIRAIVIGDQVVASMKRIAPKGEFKSNISLGATGKQIKLTEEQKDICVKASKAVGLEFSGVDLMVDENGKNYVIEVNSNPGWKIQKVCTDVNIAEEYIKFIETRYKAGDEGRDLLPLEYNYESQIKILNGKYTFSEQRSWDQSKELHDREGQINQLKMKSHTQNQEIKILNNKIIRLGHEKAELELEVRSK